MGPYNANVGVFNVVPNISETILIPFVSQEALSGAAHGLPGPVQSVEALGGLCSGPLGPPWSEEALVDVGLISKTLTGALGA